MNLYGHQNGKDGFVFSLSMTLTCTFRRIYDRVKIPLCKNYNLQECKSSLILGPNLLSGFIQGRGITCYWKTFIYLYNQTANLHYFSYLTFN